MASVKFNPLYLLTFLFFFFVSVTTGYAQCGCAAPISVFPHQEDFEGEIQCPTGCGPTCNLVGSWSNDATHDLDWTSDVGGTGSANTGPSVDFNPGTNIGKYLYTETSCNGTGYSDMVSVINSSCYDFTSNSAPFFEFAYHMFGASIGTMEVEVSTDDCTSFTTVSTESGDMGDVWNTKKILLNAYAGQPMVHIRIKATSGTSFTGDLAVDDLIVGQFADHDLAIADVQVGGITCASAVLPLTITIENRGANSETNFPVSFDIDGGTPVVEMFTDTLNSGDSVDFTFAAPLVFPATGPSTVNILVDLATDENPSDNTATAPTNVVPVVASFPSLTDFESGQDGWNIGSSTNGTWAFGTPAKITIQGAASGANAWVTGGLGVGLYENNDNSDVVSPCYDFSGNGAPAVDMQVWWNSEFSWDGAVLQSSIDGTDTWQNVGAFNDPENWYNDNTINGNPGGQGDGWSGRPTTGNGSNGWVTSRHFLDNLGGQPNVFFRIAFGSDGSVQDDGFAFDDFAIDQVVTASKTDVLLVDNDEDGRADPGDTLRYTVVLINNNFAELTNVIFKDGPIDDLSLVIGSVMTSQGTVTLGNTAGDTTVEVDTSDAGTLPVAPAGAVTITFDMLIDDPLPSDALMVCNQGNFSADGIDKLETDDPSVNGTIDQTCTDAFNDNDNDGLPNSGDGCPDDASKSEPLVCGCGVAEADTDGDGTLDCNDQCVDDPNKTEPGPCLCGTPDDDLDGNGIPDCLFGAEIADIAANIGLKANGLKCSKKKGVKKATRKKIKALLVLIDEAEGIAAANASELVFAAGADLGTFNAALKKLERKLRKLRVASRKGRSVKVCKKARRKMRRANDGVQENTPTA